jgi:hypothetical protein
MLVALPQLIESPESFFECFGVFPICKTPSHIVLIVPPLAASAPNIKAALAMEFVDQI